jgi:hypothetical protein
MKPSTRAAQRSLLAQVQRAARRLDSRYLELFYQASYLDLARRTPWVEDVPLASPSGGTASFSQLYTLLLATTQHRPERVLEIGVGLSTRLLRQYGAASGVESVHVDSDASWLDACGIDCDRATALHAPLAPTRVGGRMVDWYSVRPQGRFDFVLVDGPESWDAARRFNRLGFATWVPSILADEFLIVVDDTSRRGERELVDTLIASLRGRYPQLKSREIVGANSQTILATPRFASMLYI